MKNMYPKILASAVIRSNVRKRYDGGIYLVDLQNKTFEQKLDWNLDKVNWSNGDIGCRHLTYWRNLLYCSSSEDILVFDKQFNLIKRFTHPYLRGTHQLWIHKDKLYTLANQFDSILVFDLIKEEFTEGFQLKLDKNFIQIFDPNKFQLEGSDIYHLDMVSVRDDILWIGGSQLHYAIGLNLNNYNIKFVYIEHVSKFNGTHNLRHFKNGWIYCLSDENEVCFQKDGKLDKLWKPPITENIIWSISSDYSKTYPRGLEIYKDNIIVGSSPAKVMVFDLEHNKPTTVVEISKDIRVSICGLCQYEE